MSTAKTGGPSEATEPRPAEPRPQEPDEWLRLALEAARIGLWEWDVASDRWYLSRTFYTSLGYEPRTVPEDRDEWLGRVHPDDRALVLERIQGAPEKDHLEPEYEARLRHADGTYRWLLVRGVSVARDEHGQVSRLLGVSMDITDRRRADEQRERTARELAEAQRIAHLGSWNLDLVNNALTWSDEIYRIFEIDPDRFGASYEAFLNAIHPDDRDLVNSAYSASVKSRLPYDIVHRLRMEDGRIKYVHEKCETYYADDGRPLRSAGTVHDITDRKQAEDEIRQLNQQLEARVVQRTAQLEESNRELEAFAYSVSHDLRTPLRAIDGYRGLLESRIGGLLDDESRRYLESISRGATRMGRLIDDLLAYSRMGRAGLMRGPVDMGALVREVVEELSPLAATRDVRWHIEGLPQATGDRPMLRLVLQNLLSNALKFTATRATANVTVGSRDEGAETVFHVRDNGVGFDMQYAGKLFGVFQRLHGVEEFEGIGIGLAKVRRIIDLHGGRTWAEGQVNQGATFCFSLPQRPPGHEARTRLT